MSYLNDNLCECGHPKTTHIKDDKFESKACSLNQKQCDCWQFKIRYTERRDFVSFKSISSK